jgi:hypothetical protein
MQAHEHRPPPHVAPRTLHTAAGVTITAQSDGDFLQACVDQLMPASAGAVLKHEQGHFDITKLSADEGQKTLRFLVGGFPTEVTTCGKPGEERIAIEDRDPP